MIDPRWYAPIARGRTAFARLHYRTLETEVIQVGDVEHYEIGEEPALVPCDCAPQTGVRARILRFILKEMWWRSGHTAPDRWLRRLMARRNIPEWAHVELIRDGGFAYTQARWREFHEVVPVGYWAKRRDFAARRTAIRKRIRSAWARRFKVRHPWLGAGLVSHKTKGEREPSEPAPGVSFPEWLGE